MQPYPEQEGENKGYLQPAAIGSVKTTKIHGQEKNALINISIVLICQGVAVSVQ